VQDENRPRAGCRGTAEMFEKMAPGAKQIVLARDVTYFDAQLRGNDFAVAGMELDEKYVAEAAFQFREASRPVLLVLGEIFQTCSVLNSCGE